MADDDLRARFELDTREALQKLLDMKMSVEKIGEAKNLEGLVSGLGKVATMAGVLGASYFALKTTFDLVFDAEKIKSLNRQFEILSGTAGVSAEKLRSGLLSASKGLIDEEEIIQVANKSLVTMGSAAAKLPELMELARKASIVFGKDTKETFETLTDAIGRGNTRMLANMGIVVDADAATRKYAESLGIAENAMSDVDRRQAILNEVLSKGNDATKDIDESVLKVTNNWQRMKVAIADIGDTIALITDKYFGPAINKMVEWTSYAATYWKEFFEDAIGDESDKATKKIETNNERVKESNLALAQVNEERRQKEKDLESKFLKEMADLHRTSLEARKQAIWDEAQIERLIQEEKVLLNEQTETKIAEIKKSKDLDVSQKKEEIRLVEQLALERMIALEQSGAERAHNMKMKLYDDLERRTDNFFAKMELRSKKATERAAWDFKNFAMVGANAMTGFADRISDGFEQVGAGTKTLGQAMKESILGALADQAAGRGKLLIAESIWPPNPLALAAGAGLLALAGVLRSAAGGGGSSLAGPSAAGAAAGQEEFRRTEARRAATEDYSPEPISVSESERSRKSVTIQIMGNYFETEQTRQKLVEIIRESADYTDFKIQSVGGGL